MSFNPRVSIVCACKNEMIDIYLALESSVAQTYLNKEILFVDDSTDGTDQIILKYENKGVQLIRGKGHGCCEARNLGVMESSGDIILYITADTRLNPDYIEKVIHHFKDDKVDYVVVDATSFNMENMFSRFIEYQHKYDLLSVDPCTSQGYLVRKSSALKVGLISGMAYPHNFCRDWSLGKKIDLSGGKKVQDLSLVVKHKSPDNFLEYWTVRQTRGEMSAYQKHYLELRSLYYIFTVWIFHVIKFLVPTLIPLRPLYVALRYYKFFSPTLSGFSEFFTVAYVEVIQSLSFVWGELIGLIKIMKTVKISGD